MEPILLINLNHHLSQHLTDSNEVAREGLGKSVTSLLS